jgi:hypothetical protein
MGFIMCLIGYCSQVIDLWSLANDFETQTTDIYQSELELDLGESVY